MSIFRSARYFYILTCDKCGKRKYVEENSEAYNAPQAARSAGWSYGRNKTTLCEKCRPPYTKHGLND